MKLIQSFCILAFVLLCGIVMPASAVPLPQGMTTVPLATITNDRDTSVSEINLILGSQAMVRGIYLETKAGADSGTAAASEQIHWLGGIESDDGVVLGQGQGVEAIFLRGNIESQSGYGSLVIRYLTNGIFGHYDECRVDLQRLAPQKWQLVNSYNNKPIEHIEVQTWALGISTIGNVCPAA